MEEIVIRDDNVFPASDTLNLTIPKNKLGEFVKGLLGRPFEISSKVNEEFDVDQEWVNQTLELVTQRVRQNSSELVQFSGTISFGKGIEKKFSSVEQFMNYVNTQNLQSFGIAVDLTYLVVFPERSVPERQQIIFSAKATKSFLKKYTSIHDDPSDQNLITYNIRATERTWAEDVEKILRERVASCLVEEAGHQSLLKKMRKILSGICVVASFSVPIFLEYIRVNRRRQEIDHELDFSILSSSESFSKIYKLIIDYMDGGTNIFHIFFYIVFAILFLISAMILTEYRADQRSFVVYGDKMRNEQKEFRLMQRRNPLNILRDFSIGVIASAVVSYIFLSFQWL